MTFLLLCSYFYSFMSYDIICLCINRKANLSTMYSCVISYAFEVLENGDCCAVIKMLTSRPHLPHPSLWLYSEPRFLGLLTYSKAGE